jgi:hypothetical protein
VQKRELMTKHFLIFALPRSRTAWMSNLFTTGPVFCHHDGMRYSEDPPSLVSVMAAPEAATHVGNCDNGMAVWAEDVLNQFPDARVAVIQREPRDALASLKAYHSRQGDDIPMAACEKIIHDTQLGLDLVKASARCDLCVPFDGLDRMNVLYSLWVAMIGGGGAFDRARAEALAGMHIELHRPVYDRGITKEFAKVAYDYVEGI